MKTCEAKNCNNLIYIPKIKFSDFIKECNANNFKINDELCKKIHKNFEINHFLDQHDFLILNKDYRWCLDHIYQIANRLMKKMKKSDVIEMIDKFELDFQINQTYKLYVDCITPEITNALRLGKWELTILENSGERLESLKDFFETSWNDELNWLTYANTGLIPIYWRQNFKFLERIGHSNEKQGEKNGPDFIFLDTKTNKKIGLEISIFRKDVFVLKNHPNLNIDSVAASFMKNLDKTKGLKGAFEEARRLILKHNTSLEKGNYVKCDKYIFALVANKGFPEELYSIFQKYFNEYLTTKFDEIIIF